MNPLNTLRSAAGLLRLAIRVAKFLISMRPKK